MLEYYIKQIGSNEFVNITKFVNKHVRGSQEVNSDPHQFEFSLVPTSRNIDLNDINRGDEIAICSDDSKTEIVAYGIVEDPGRDMLTWQSSLSRPLFRFDLKCIEKDFSSAPIQEIEYNNVTFSSIVEDILTYTDDSLGYVDENNNFVKYVLNFPDFNVDLWNFRKGISTQALTELCLFFDLFWTIKYKCLPDEDEGLKVFKYIEFSNLSGLSPDTSILAEGINNENIRTELVDNPIVENRTRFPKIPANINIEVQEDPSVICNYIDLVCNIYSENDNESLTRWEKKALPNTFDYSLDNFASDIAYVGTLSLSIAKTLSGSTSTVIKVSSADAATMEANDFIIFPNRSKIQMYFIDSVNRVDTTTTELTLTEALDFTPSFDETIELINNVPVYIENQTNYASIGVMKDIEKSRPAKIRFTDLAEPPPGTKIVVFYNKIQPLKLYSENSDSIAKYGLKYREIILDDDIVLTRTEAKDLANRLLIEKPQYNVEITTKEYGIAPLGLLISFNVTDYLTESLVLKRRSWEYLGNKDFQGKANILQTLEFTNNMKTHESILKSLKLSRPATKTSEELGNKNQKEIIKIQEKISWSFNIATISFEERLIYNSNKSGQWQSYSIKSDGTDEINITNDGTKEDRYCTYSSVLDAYIFCRRVSGILEIHKMDRVSRTVIQLTTSSSHNHIFPNVSPDGTMIISNKNGNVNIISSSDGAELYNWTPVYAMNTTVGFAVFDNENKVLASSSVGTFSDISKYQLNGTLITNLNNIRGCLFGRYNSDYTKVIYRQGWLTAIDQIYTMNANGTNKTQITSDSENKEFPAFSPDELSFAYTPYITGYFDSNIDVASFADPDNETQLTTNTNNTEFNGFWGNIQV